MRQAMRKKLYSWIAIFLLAGCFTTAAKAEETAGIHSFEGKAQGTSYHIRYAATEQPQLPLEVDSFLKDFDKTFSNYRPDSEVSRFNREARAGSWFPASAELFRLVEIAQKISAKTAGRFDITLGSLLKIWGFGPYRRDTHALPSPAAIKAALAQSGYPKLLLRSAPPALQKKVAGLELDLSGIAQGYAVDRVAALLEAKGIQNYFVEIGGELKTKGAKPEGQDWLVAIDSPDPRQPAGAVVVHPQNMALATSGSYRNYFEKSGKRYAHILDPLSGQATQGELASASVLAATAAEADALAKVLMILGPERAKAWAEKEKLPSFIIVPSQGGFRTESLAGFARFEAR